MPGQVTALRPRTRDGESTREAILSTAAALLAAGGEEGLSIREVCARAGVTAPTVYHHFGDKAALVARVVDDCFPEFDRAGARSRSRRAIRSRRCAGPSTATSSTASPTRRTTG